jgi:transcriptional regulator with XRE-family HTH domain
MTDREIFKNNLAELIRTSKAKQVDIAKYAEVSYKTVSAWVTGRGYPRADAMEKLCRFFGIRQSALTEPHNPAESPEDKLLIAFRAMSTAGQDKLLERAEELRILYPRKVKKNG